MHIQSVTIAVDCQTKKFKKTTKFNVFLLLASNDKC